MARTIMYQSVYFHHKKLTAETMYRKACEKIFSILPNEKINLAFILSLSDNNMSENFQYAIVPVDLHNNQQFLEAKEIMTRIRDRCLYKRVASISQGVFAVAIKEHEVIPATAKMWRNKTAQSAHLGDCFIQKLGYLLGEIRFQITIMNHCPDSSNRRFEGWHDFCSRMVRIAQSKNRTKRVYGNEGFRAENNITL